MASKGLVGEKAPLWSNTGGVNFHDHEMVDPYDEDELDEEEGFCGWMFPFCSRNNVGYEVLAPTSVQKIVILCERAHFLTLVALWSDSVVSCFRSIGVQC